MVPARAGATSRLERAAESGGRLQDDGQTTGLLQDERKEIMGAIERFGRVGLGMLAVCVLVRPGGARADQASEDRVPQMERKFDQTQTSVAADQGGARQDADTVGDLPTFRLVTTPPQYDLNRAAGPAAPVAVLAQASPGGSGTGSAPPPADTSRFIGRLLKAYWDDFNGAPLPGDSTSTRRGYAAPVNSPPYPWSDWPYGGSYTVGTPDTTDGYPLTHALYGSGYAFTDWMKDNRIKVWGFFEVGGNVSNSNQRANGKEAGTPGFPTAGSKYANAPAAYSAIPNALQLDQATLYINRYADEAQTDHFDWGFRLTNLYGFDYRYTTTKGIFSKQLLDHNSEMGYDPVMFWLEGYWPILKGLNVRLGRYISLPDIEAQLAPDNLSYSHSLTYSYDCYTQTGLNSTLKINDNWLLQMGLSAGNDVTAWTSGKDKHPTFNTCIQTTWNDGKDSNYLCANSINLDGADAKYGYNNMAAYYNTWYHKFTEKWFIATEFWYQYERDVPSIFGTADTKAHLEVNANGGWCPAGQQFCMTKEDALVNYIEYQFDDNTNFTFRNEYFNDQEGQRTGIKDFYTEHMLGLVHFFSNTLFVRPELRYERAYNRPAYDNQSKRDQIMLAADLVFRY
jgi:hypothetical protein